MIIYFAENQTLISHTSCTKNLKPTNQYHAAGKAQYSVLPTRLQATLFGVLISVEARDFSLLKNVHISSGTHPASNAMTTGDPSGGKAMLTSHLHLVSMLQVGRAIPPPLYMSSFHDQGDHYLFFNFSSAWFISRPQHRLSQMRGLRVIPSRPQQWLGQDLAVNHSHFLPRRLHFTAHCHPIIRRNNLQLQKVSSNKHTKSQSYLTDSGGGHIYSCRANTLYLQKFNTHLLDNTFVLSVNSLTRAAHTRCTHTLHTHAAHVIEDSLKTGNLLGRNLSVN
jgi:hypothetical protein